MVEELNILLNAGVELGKITAVMASGSTIEIFGTTKDDEMFDLKLSTTEATTDDRN